MARTRAQRRRRTLLITLALVITLAFLVFGRDVSRAAHRAAAVRQSENKSFGALANGLVTSENEFDGRLYRLIAHGGSLHRDVLQARLVQLSEQLSNWSVVASQVRSPDLAHHVNAELATLTEQRIDDYQTLFDDVAHDLSLPWNPLISTPVANPAASLTATAKQWNEDRFALKKEPGHVHLKKTSTKTAMYFAQNGASDLVHSSTLALVRAIGIGALRVTPSALPSASNVMLLPPVTSVQLGISIVNKGYDLQPVTLSIRVTPLNHLGSSFTQSLSATIGPLAAYAFLPKSFGTAPSEKATVVISVTGAKAASGLVTKQAYRLELSPSGVTTTN